MTSGSKSAQPARQQGGQPVARAPRTKDNFFKLREEDRAKIWNNQGEFWADVATTAEITDALYRPDALAREGQFRSIDERTFKNVSFAKTRVTGISFKQCWFEDCLFIDTDFVECEFHNCYFLNCNTFKASYSKCYLDPLSFRDSFKLNPSNYSNISMWLYKSLIVNSIGMGQHQFRASAEYLFRQCQRYNLWKKKQHRELTGTGFWIRLVLSHLHNILTGYGWRPLRLILAMCAATVLLIAINIALWDKYGILDSNRTALRPTLLDAVAYTLGVLTTLGFGHLTPTTTFGLFAASIQGVLGVIFFAFIASISLRYVVKSAE
jgi:hypothetical protein